MQSILPARKSRPSFLAPYSPGPSFYFSRRQKANMHKGRWRSVTLGRGLYPLLYSTHHRPSSVVRLYNVPVMSGPLPRAAGWPPSFRYTGVFPCFAAIMPMCFSNRQTCILFRPHPAGWKHSRRAATLLQISCLVAARLPGRCSDP